MSNSTARGNRPQRRQDNSIKGVSKNVLLARAQAAEASTQMFRQFYEEQIRASERIVIESERLVQKAQLEQRATERTIEVMLFQLIGIGGDAYPVSQEAIDAFNENDEDGEHFVRVEQTDEGFDMTLVFEPFEQEDEDGTDTADADTDEQEDSDDLGQDGESDTGVSDEAE